MTLTGAQLLQGFSEFIEDWQSSTTTSAGNAGGTTLIDTYLRRYGDNRLEGVFVRINETGDTSNLQVRRANTFSNSTGTVTVAPAFAAQIGSAKGYELHRYDPVLKFRALDKARFDVADEVFQYIFDETVTADGVSTEYNIPTTLVSGPVTVHVERPLTADLTWNFLNDPIGDSTTNYTASSATISTVTRTDNDLLVPKYDTTCMKIVVAASTAATVSQVVGSMTNNITAAAAAGRRMTFAAWVYSKVASKIRLQIVDDTGTVNSSAYHQGGGWELLSVQGTISPTNTTTLTARFSITSTASALTAYFNRGWFYYGDHGTVTGVYPSDPAFTLRRDNTTQHITLTEPPPRGYQLRMIGTAPLSALGSTASTQVSNTMEVDNQTAELLYARAAEILFDWERIKADDVNSVSQRIATVRSRYARLRRNWGQTTLGRRVVTPWG